MEEAAIHLKFRDRRSVHRFGEDTIGLGRASKLHRIFVVLSVAPCTRGNYDEHFMST